jgi:hypothetical protein
MVRMRGCARRLTMLSAPEVERCLAPNRSVHILGSSVERSYFFQLQRARLAR